MNRRNFVQLAAGGAFGGMAGGSAMKAQEKQARATRGVPSPKIKEISVIATQPAGARPDCTDMVALPSPSARIWW